VQSRSSLVPWDSKLYFIVPILETPPTWKASCPYLYPQGTGWPSYTPGHWVPFLSPLTTRRDYGGGILTSLHTGKREIFLLYHIQEFSLYLTGIDRLCGLVVRVLDFICRGPGFDSRALQKKVVGLERGPLSLVSTTEELLDRKVAAPV
jgi:hypothetical protein